MSTGVPFVPPSQGGPFPDGSPAGLAQYQAQLDAQPTYQREAPALAAYPAPMTVDTAVEPKKTRAKKAPAGTGKAAAEISPELVASLESKRAFYAETLLEIQGAPLNTQEHVDMLSGVAAQCKAELKALEEQRESITKPLNAALTAANRLFKPPMEFLKSCEAAIKNKINARLAEQRQLQSTALQLVAENNGRVDQATMATAVGVDLVKAPEGSYEVESWTCEIVDATQLPAPYWIPNMDMLEDTAKRQKSAAIVPGVRFFATKALRIRTA